MTASLSGLLARGTAGGSVPHAVVKAAAVSTWKVGGTGPSAPPGPAHSRWAWIDEGTWCKRITAALRVRGGHVPHREAADWAAGVGDLIDEPADVFDAGRTEDVMRLAEWAHRRANRAIGSAQGSDGWLTGILVRLAGSHLRACRECRPSRVGPAGRPADFGLSSGLSGFRRAAAAYAEVPGAAGLGEYRRRLDNRRPALHPDAREWSTERFTLRGGDPECARGRVVAARLPHSLASTGVEPRPS